MTIDDNIRDEKIQYDINREAAKISALSSGKIDKYEFLTGDEILLSHQSRITEQVNFTYSPLAKAFEKQIKTIEDQGIRQAEALKALKSEEDKDDIKSMEGVFQKDMRSNESKIETYEVKKWEEKSKRKDVKCETNIQV